jgi:HK97 family phage prohead protease
MPNMMPLQLRDAACRSDSYDEASNTIQVTFTTGAVVRRRSWISGDYDEELIVSKDSVRLDRLNRGAPFLNTHGQWTLSDVIGNVVPGTARIQGGKGHATVQLSRTEGDKEVVQKIRDGNIKNISVGYQVHRVEKIERNGDVPLWRIVDWEPHEISAVPVPADSGAQIRSGTTLYAATITDALVAAARHRMAVRQRMLLRQMTASDDARLRMQAQQMLASVDGEILLAGAHERRHGGRVETNGPEDPTSYGETCRLSPRDLPGVPTHGHSAPPDALAPDNALHGLQASRSTSTLRWWLRGPQAICAKDPRDCRA